MTQRLDQLKAEAKALLGQSFIALPLDFEALPKPQGVPLASLNPDGQKIAEANSNLGSVDPQNVTYNNDPNVSIGVLRNSNGRPVVMAHEGSASMIYGFTRDIEVLKRAPGLLQEILAELE